MVSCCRSGIRKNLVVTEGKNKLLDVAFSTASKITTWYIGLITSTSFSAIAAADTFTGIGTTNGWGEFTSYSGTNRPAWAPNTNASAGSLATATASTFSITGSGTVKGLFLAGGGSAATKGTVSSGTLWCGTLFSGGDRAVVNLDTLNVSYTVST